MKCNLETCSICIERDFDIPVYPDPAPCPNECEGRSCSLCSPPTTINKLHEEAGVERVPGPAPAREGIISIVMNRRHFQGEGGPCYWCGVLNDPAEDCPSPLDQSRSLPILCP